LPTSEKIFVPLLPSVPMDANQSAPLLIISGTFAQVSTNQAIDDPLSHDGFRNDLRDVLGLDLEIADLLRVYNHYRALLAEARAARLTYSNFGFPTPAPSALL
jgi:hypothetical protein